MKFLEIQVPGAVGGGASRRWCAEAQEEAALKKELIPTGEAYSFGVRVRSKIITLFVVKDAGGGLMWRHG